MALPVAVAAAAAFSARLALALAEAAAALKAVEVALAVIDPNRQYPVTRGVGILTDYINEAIYELEGHGLAWACAWMGVPIDPSAPLTKYSLTQAINEGVLQGTGLHFTNLFDGDSIKRDMRRIALEQLGGSLGLKNTGTVKDLVAGMRGYAVEKILNDKQALAALGIKPSATLMATLARYGQPMPNDPINMTKKGIANRERQAAYRASRNRIWVPR